MGVGISLSRLAGAVARAGGVGVISGVEIGYNWPEYNKDKNRANREALIWHLQRAREQAPDGIIGVNIMVALTNYEAVVATAVEGGADIIFSGAGLPLSLPALVKGSKVKIAPIVSSAKAAALITRQWVGKHGRIPDALVVEGPLAGGHLGFSREQLEDTTGQFALENILGEVLEALKALNVEVPVIAGGGVWTGSEIARLLRLGAAGVQMSTRFVATEECDAPPQFKQAYLQAEEQDVVIIDSPVGMPGRAITNDFLEAARKGYRQPELCVANCLKPCNPAKTPYCIASALINAAYGQLDEGFAFCGAYAHRLSEVTTVQTLMDELVAEIERFSE
jgi:NAD(P)H-dependent flavin oxidoreductase YrpB (nitropropane dioxygenase family)